MVASTKRLFKTRLFGTRVFRPRLFRGGEVVVVDPVYGDDQIEVWDTATPIAAYLVARAYVSEDIMPEPIETESIEVFDPSVIAEVQVAYSQPASASEDCDG